MRHCRRSSRSAPRSVVSRATSTAVSCDSASRSRFRQEISKMKRTSLAILLAATAVTASAQPAIPYPALAQRIVKALAVERGERVLLRYDRETLGPLEAEVKAQLEAKGAK